MPDVTSPRVTVAIPTYNRARFLREAIESALAQTVRELEVVVSDNASDDDTAAVVASFDDPRLRYSRLDSNIGLHGNLTRCLRAGSAPYLAILQDDDALAPTNVERKLEALELQPRAVLAHAPFRFVDEHGRTLSESVDWWKAAETHENGLDFIRRMVRWGVRVDMSSWLLRRDAVGEFEFSPEDGLATDFGFLLRVGLRGDIVYVREPLTSVRRHSGSLSVAGESVMLPGGHYAPSFAYTLACRAATERFLREHGDAVPEPEELRRASRAWARRELASVVRIQAGEEPEPRRTLDLVRRAARADAAVLLRRKVALTVGWALVGRRGRSLVRRLASRSVPGGGAEAREG